MEDKPLTSINDLATRMADYTPSLLAGMVVFLLGMVLAWASSRLVVRLLILSRMDRVIVRLGWSRTLAKGDLRHSLYAFVGSIVGALVFFVFLDNAVVIWQLTVLSQLLDRFVALIPKVIGASIVMLVGWGLATGVSRSVRSVLYQEEFARAGLVGSIVHAAIIVVASAIALVQLEVAVTIVNGAFLIAFGSLALCFVLAFGLGSKKAVEAMWENQMKRPGGKADVKSPEDETPQTSDGAEEKAD